MKRRGRVAGRDASLRRRDETFRRESIEPAATFRDAEASQQAYL